MYIFQILTPAIVQVVEYTDYWILRFSKLIIMFITRTFTGWCKSNTFVELIYEYSKISHLTHQIDCDAFYVIKNDNTDNEIKPLFPIASLEILYYPSLV